MTQTNQTKSSEGDLVKKLSSSSTSNGDEDKSEQQQPQSFMRSENKIVTPTHSSTLSSNLFHPQHPSDPLDINIRNLNSSSIDHNARKQRYERRSKSIAFSDDITFGSNKPILASRTLARKKSLSSQKSVRFRSAEFFEFNSLKSILDNITEDNLISVAKILASVRHEVSSCAESLHRFIEDPVQGIEVLFNLLRKSESQASSSSTPPSTKSSGTLPSFAWAYLQLEVLNCIRVIMDSPIGIQQIIGDETNYAEKLASALDTSNRTIKKQIFDLLSALCVYSKDGHWKTLQTLNHYKTIKRLNYRFEVIVDELAHAKNLEYKATLIGLINCLIISAGTAKERISVRDEFIGLKILDILANLKHESGSAELLTQIELFEEQRASDENTEQLDVNSHQDVFYAILKQTSGRSEYEIPFLHILQHLLTIDYNKHEYGGRGSTSAIIWNATETLVHRATSMIESREDADRLLRVHLRRQSSFEVSPNHSKISSISNPTSPSDPLPPPSMPPTPAPRSSSRPLSPENRSDSISSSPVNAAAAAPIPPPPPPPPPPPLSASCPPPPPRCPSNLNDNFIPPGLSTSTPASTAVLEITKLPHLAIPKPKSKLKSLNWSKIPSQKVILAERPNIWSMMATETTGIKNTDVDFDTLEGLFSQPGQLGGTGSAPNSCSNSPKLHRRVIPSSDTSLASSGSSNSLERKVVKRLNGDFGCTSNMDTINLLDGKKSLTVNIFLKQFRGSVDELINYISIGNHQAIGMERLRSLMKLLPEPNEIDLLLSHKSDIAKMPIAEKFLLQLLGIQNYKLRIECMHLKEELDSNIASLEPSISIIKTAANEIKTNKSLHDVMYLILVAGNFLNSGGYAGDAVGFKMMSLNKLSEIRANKPGVSLIHYVALEAEKKNLVGFLDCFTCFEDAAKISVESLKDEIKAISNKITNIKQQIHSFDYHVDNFFAEMSFFLEDAEREVDKLMKSVEVEIETTRSDLADFLCEEVNQFKLEDCFAVLTSFCQRFKLAMDENERRRANEIKSERRRKNRNNISPRTSMVKSEPSGSGDFMSNNHHSLTNGSSTDSSSSSPPCSSSTSKLSPEDELHLGLMELLKSTNELSTSSYDSAYGSLRRVGSGRRTRPSTLFGESSRERSLNNSCNNIKESDLIEEKSNDTDSRSDSLDSFQENKKRRAFATICSPIDEYGHNGHNQLITRHDSRDDESETPKKTFNQFRASTKSKVVSPTEPLITPLELKKFWSAKAERYAARKNSPLDNYSNSNHGNISSSADKFDSNNNYEKSSYRHNNPDSHPLAIITPTKMYEDSDNLSNNGINSINSSHRNSTSTNYTSNFNSNNINTKNNTNFTAAYVKPLQFSEKQSNSINTLDSNDDKLDSTEQLKRLMAKSKLPVRQSAFTKPPKYPKQNSGDESSNSSSSQHRSAIPILSRNNSRVDDESISRLNDAYSRNRYNHQPININRQTSSPMKFNSYGMDNFSNIRSPSLVKVRRQQPSAQSRTFHEPRSFMRETSSSAAKVQRLRAVK